MLILSTIVSPKEPPDPQYTNPGGTGDRTSAITVTWSGIASPGWQGGTTSQTVNGTKGTSNGVYINNASVANVWIKFDFGSGASKVINEVKHYQDTTDSHGTWKWQGSDNDTDWTDIGGNFTHGGATTNTITTLSANTTGYRYYRMIGVSGNGNNSAWQTEWEFKIDDA